MAIEPSASEPRVCRKNLDLADRPCSTDHFQIVLNDPNVALVTRSTAKLRRAPNFALGGKADIAWKSDFRFFDPKRTLLRYRVDTVRWGAVVQHGHEHIARF